MAKHTSGPWFASVIPAEHGEPQKAVIRAFDSICGMRNSGDYVPEEFKANAQLIATAPELYAALKRIEESAENWAASDRDEVLRIIKPVLAKADCTAI